MSRPGPRSTPAAPQDLTARSRRAALKPRSALAIALPLIVIGAAVANTASAGTVLPTGGKVVAGSATIQTPTGFSLTITQPTSKAIIDWTSFKIGAGGTVQFSNGSGVTLNRVTGGGVTSIDGLLSATGGVYVLNPNGVLIGKSGVVNVGGSFVASSLDVTNEQFMAGGALNFNGPSAAPVANAGQIIAANGDVALIAAQVDNTGGIEAPRGDAALAAGHSVVLASQAQDDGKLSVLVGGANTSVTNQGQIDSAEAELRANGGNIYALALNAGSRIDATGISASDGNVYIVADGGSVTAQGEIDATRADGSGGLVETSGKTVNFDGLRVRAGDWLVDPVNLTIDAASAATIDSNLATTSVTLQTTASSASGPGVQSSGAGDITVASTIDWSSSSTLTLDAYRSIIFQAPVYVGGAGQVVLKTNDGGSGGDYSFAPGGSLSFLGTAGGGQGLTINGQVYSLIYSEADLLQMNNNLAGDYALAGPLDLSTFIFTDAPVASSASYPFAGVFTGLGNSISNLDIRDTIALPQTINQGPNNGVVGLFGIVGANGVVRDVNVVNASVSGGDAMAAGALAGDVIGTVTNATSSGEVTVGNSIAVPSGGTNDAYAGGLVGGVVGGGDLTNSSSSATVIGGDAFVGGLAGVATTGGTVTSSSASGNVSVGATGIQVASAGGLVGLVDGDNPAETSFQLVTISRDHSSGNVTGGAGSLIGGFTGYVREANFTSSYATGNVTQTAPGLAGGQEDWEGGFLAVTDVGVTVTQSYASGAVASTGGVDSYSYSAAGGFAGVVAVGSSVADSYALGAVTATGSPFSLVGGFAGTVLSNASIARVYSSGAVSGPGVVAGLVGLVGSNTISVTEPGFLSDSYWDQGTSGDSVGYFILGAGTATNVVAVGGAGPSAYAASTYANLDLANTWYIIDGQTRPILRSEYSTNIVNAHQLELMTLDLSGSYTLGADIDASETSSASGVWNPANGFVPVGGNNEAQFTGGLEGDGHTVSNLFINYSTVVPQLSGANFPINGFAGLFGVIGAGASVDDVRLTSANVTAADTMSAGILAGADFGGNISNAFSSGAVTSGNPDTSTNPVTVAGAGGLVGIVSLAGTVSDSSSFATATSGGFAGGLVGALANGASIVNSSASGDVTLTGTTTNASGGGLVGVVYGYGEPGFTTDPNVATISGSHATGSVAGGSGLQVGGFAGLIQNGQISDSYATGSVSQTGTSAINGSAIGGFAGIIQFSHLANVYATGSVSQTGVATTQAQVAGGFVGDVQGGTLSGAYSSGVVSTVGGPTSGNPTFAGGFAGVVDTATITDAYSLSPVTSTGTENVLGGFAGIITTTASVPGVASITNFYATGQVSNTGAVGGLIGLTQPGTVSNGYWDEGTSGQTAAIGFNDGGSVPTNLVGVGGSTGLNPYAASSYANFDLANTWFMINGETRPILRAEYSTLLTNAHQLELISLNLAAGYTLGGDINASETTSIYGVWNPANGFVPVGGNGTGPFTGLFDGAGHTISNLTVIDTTPSLQASIVETNGAVGLFGYIDNGAIIEDVSLANVTAIGGDGMRVGGIVGIAGDSTLLEVSSSGSVTTGSGVNDSQGGTEVAGAGGLVAFSQGVISSSSSSANVTAADGYAGGLVGTFAGSAVEDSHASGNVTTGGDNGPINSTAGGLIALLGSPQNTDGLVVGSYATGNVTGGAGSFVGGFVGVIQTGAEVTGSYATGTVTQLAGAQAPGGASAAGDIAGGFVGAIFDGTVATSFSTGAVNTVAGANATLDANAGGFAGQTLTGSITDSYATGSVTVTGPPFALVGGFVGYVTETNVQNVYATGLVSAPGGASVAGLVGQVDVGGTLTNDYWDAGTTGQASGIAVDTGGPIDNVTGIGGSTGVDPFSASTYQGFDFTNTWSTPSAGFYPQLYGVSHVLHVIGGSTTSVYGAYPIGTISIIGLQPDDADLSLPSSLLDVNLANTTLSSSGNYNVGGYAVVLSDLNVTGASGAYRTLYSSGQLTVTAAPLTATLGPGAIEKTYDGTTSATVPTGDITLSGLIAGDNVAAVAASGSYQSKDAGAGLLVSASGLTLTGADAEDYSVNATASAAVGVIDPKALDATLTGLVAKTYDGTTTASLAAGEFSLTGVVAGDDVNLQPGSGAYASKNAGAGIEVSASGLSLGGTDAGNYTVNSSASGAVGEIDPKALNAALTGVVTKTYDGTTAASLSAGEFSLTGVVAGDDVVLQPGPGAYASKDAGTGIAVSATGLSLIGADAGDYTVNSSAAAAVGEIDPKTLAVSLIGTVEKTYDGTTSASLSANDLALSGVVAGDNVALDVSGGAYQSKDAGVGLMVSATGLTLTGADAEDYAVNATASGPVGVIDPKALDATLTGLVTKTYDGTTAASLAAGEFTLTGVVAGDDVDLQPGSGAYASKNVGAGIEVSASGLSLGGADAGNYTVNSSAAGAVGEIDPKTLAVSLIGTVEKTYDGTTAASLPASDLAISGVVAGDDVMIAASSAAYQSKNAGAGILVTANGLSLTGTDAGNYTVGAAASAPVGLIDPKALDATLVGSVVKTYDGSTAASFSPSEFSLAGVLAGDDVDLKPAVGAYASKNVGMGITVTATGLSLDGSDAGNYTVNTSASGALGEIDPKTLAVSLVGQVEKTYDGTTAAKLTPGNYALTGIVGGDDVSLNDPTVGAYDNPQPGANKTVTVDGLLLTGSSAGNYQVGGTAAANIGLIVSATQPIQTQVVTVPPQGALTEALTVSPSEVRTGSPPPDGTEGSDQTEATFVDLSGGAPSAGQANAGPSSPGPSGPSQGNNPGSSVEAAPAAGQIVPGSPGTVGAAGSSDQANGSASPNTPSGPSAPGLTEPGSPAVGGAAGSSDQASTGASPSGASGPGQTNPGSPTAIAVGAAGSSDQVSTGTPPTAGQANTSGSPTEAGSAASGQTEPGSPAAGGAAGPPDQANAGAPAAAGSTNPGQTNPGASADAGPGAPGQTNEGAGAPGTSETPAQLAAAGGAGTASNVSTPGAGPTAQSGGPRQTVYTVFPLSNQRGKGQLSGNGAPVTGAGNGDLWSGSDLDDRESP